MITLVIDREAVPHIWGLGYSPLWFWFYHQHHVRGFGRSLPHWESGNKYTDLRPTVDPRVACEWVLAPPGHGPGAPWKTLVQTVIHISESLCGVWVSNKVPEHHWSKNIETGCAKDTKRNSLALPRPPLPQGNTAQCQDFSQGSS